MYEVKRVIVIGASNIGRGGRSTIAYNICNAIAENDFCFDYLCMEYPIRKKYSTKISKKGGRVLFDYKNKYHYKIFYNLRRLYFYCHSMRKGNYDIAYIQADDASEYFPRALLCRLCGVKFIVAHGHTAQKVTKWQKFKHILFQRLMPLVCNYVIGVSQDALDYLYSYNNIQKCVINNGINIEEYKFNQESRESLRNGYKWQNKTVLGNIGRLHESKNQEFLIDILYELKKIDKNVLLVIVGEGSKKRLLQKKIKKLNLSQEVILWGGEDSVGAILSAMDMFIFPSLYEGFGLVALEAQCSGLPTYVSQNIPDSACITSCVSKLSLDNNAVQWAKFIYGDYLKKERKIDRTKAYQEIIDSGMSVYNTSQKVKDIFNRLF